MKTLNGIVLLIPVLVLIIGGCTPQPPAQAQADFNYEFTLRTIIKDGRMVFIGVGGEIDGVVNPDLMAQQGDIVHLVLVNGDGIPHDLAVPDLGAQTTMIMNKDSSTDIVFEAKDVGVFPYYCTVAGHRQAGMEGVIVISEP